MDGKQIIEKANGNLRLTLPLMSRNKVSVTPRNYTLWYKYVSGESNDLNKVIDAMISEGESFTEDKNEKLFRRFCEGRDEKELMKLKEDLQKVSVTILNEVTQLNGQTENYESLVSSSAARLSGSSSIQEIKDIVNEIVDGTKVIGTFSKKMKQKFNDVTVELETVHKKFEQAKTESLNDFLTGIPNRKAFHETLAMRVEESISNNKNLCLLMIDIDHFKGFNDIYGHIVGDEVLKLVARKIKKIARGGDFLARYGGEEFAMILPQTPLHGARIVSENIRDFFAKAKLKTLSTSKQLGTITVSIGVSCYRLGEPLEKFIDRSDQALYYAKNTGRNRIATELKLASNMSD